MRSRWYHAPILHVPADEHGGKSVSWLELFYDLIFVAAIIQLGNHLSDNVTASGFALFALHFVPLWIAWTGFTFYANRFNVDDFAHRLLVFSSMFAVGTMAIAAPEAMSQGIHKGFSVAYAVAQALVAALNYRSYRQVPDSRAYSGYWAAVFAAGAVVWLLSAFIPHPYNYVGWGVGLLIILGAPISEHSRALADAFPTDYHHLSERYGLLTIIVLGESFVKVLSYLGAGDRAADFEYILKGFFNLVLTCCIWWIYFDDIAGSKIRKQRFSWVVWLYGHLPLTLAITAVGVAVKKAIKLDLGALAYGPTRWLLAGTLALTLLSVAVIDSVTERRNAELSDRARINARSLSAILLLLVAAAGGAMRGGTFLAIVTALCVAQVLFDMMMAPLEESPDTVITLSRDVHMRDTNQAKGPGADGATRKRPRRVDVSEAVRKGAPTELRRDLYFFFMEGSWQRVLVTFAFLFAMVNVLFAALYLLSPGSVAGVETFPDAFAFSVQTLATIGYGALAPTTGYANVIVTLEAAAGILFVALSTGLMFAKASRPQSSVLFSKPMVVTTRHGVPTLMFRVANARGNEVVDASLTVSVLVDEMSPEGHHLRRLHDVELMRSRSPMFVLSWVVMHEIDDTSPLRDVDWERPEDHLSVLTITMLGHDGTYGQTTYARHIYYPEDIRYGHRFIDVLSQLDDGRLMIDLTQFHDTVRESAADDDSSDES